MPTIKSKRNFKKLPIPALSTRAHAVAGGMKNNPDFATPPPPVDPNTLLTAAHDLDTKQAEALDGGKKAKEALVKAKDTVIEMLDLLANHVETYSKDDMNTFLSSGFEAKAATKAPATVAIDQPTLKTVKQGISGQGVVQINGVKGARSYFIQYGAMGAGGAAPINWSISPAVNSRPATKINGLTPATTYAFQVRALGPEGFTDWSPSITRTII